MKNFTSFIVDFSHLAFSSIISCDDGTFTTFSASEETLDTPDDAKLLICTSLVGLDFLRLLRIVTLLGVLTRKGAVINLYAEASKPSFLGAASGVLVTSYCSTKASSFICIYRSESAK